MKYYKLNDLCTDIVDCPHTTPDWKNEGIRVVRNFNLKDGNLDFTDGYFVDEVTYLERRRYYNFKRSSNGRGRYCP